jgi:hypothetical protein
MGQAKNYRKRFLERYPYCVFCGGTKPATTIEHCPPRAFFQHRHWPEGFEFPACERCNRLTSDEDVLVAMLGRLDPVADRGDLDGRFAGLLKNVNAQYPGLLAKMMPSPAEARRHNRGLGITPKPGQSHQEASGINVTEEVHHAVCIFGRKLANAVYFREAGQAFPIEGCLLLNWFSNADMMRDGKPVILELLQHIAGNAPMLERGGKYLNDQFEYKYSSDTAHTICLLQAKFGNAFGLAVFGSVVRGRLEGTVEELLQQHGHAGPFVAVQSPTIEPDFMREVWAAA